MENLSLKYYVIVFKVAENSPLAAYSDILYCRAIYKKDASTNELIYNGYSLMDKWTDATLFNTKEEALVILLNSPKEFPKKSLKIIKIHIESEVVYE